MPGQDGLDVLAGLRRASDVPVILLDGQGRRGRPGPGLPLRRRRLRGQAVLQRRAGGAHRRGAPTGGGGAAEAVAPGWSSRAWRSTWCGGRSRCAATWSTCRRGSTKSSPSSPRRPARSSPGSSCSTRCGRRRPIAPRHRHRAHRSPPAPHRGGPGTAQMGPHRPWRRLPVRAVTGPEDCSTGEWGAGCATLLGTTMTRVDEGTRDLRLVRGVRADLGDEREDDPGAPPPPSAMSTVRPSPTPGCAPGAAVVARRTSTGSASASSWSRTTPRSATGCVGP